MVHVAGLPWDAPWLAWSIGLYVLAVACWLPVVWLQMRMRDLARHAAATQSRVPSASVGTGEIAASASLGAPHIRCSR